MPSLPRPTRLHDGTSSLRLHPTPYNARFHPPPQAHGPSAALRTAPTSGLCVTPPSHIAHATPLGLCPDCSQTVTTPAPTPQVLLAALLALVLYSLLTPSEKRHRLVYLLTVCLFPPDTSSPRPGAQLCSQMDLQHLEQHQAPSRCSVIPAGSTPPPSPSTETIGLPRSPPPRAYAFSCHFSPVSTAGDIHPSPSGCTMSETLWPSPLRVPSNCSPFSIWLVRHSLKAGPDALPPCFYPLCTPQFCHLLRCLSP